MTQDIKLAPCPFCGGEAQTDFIEGESYLIECYACRAETGIKDSEAEAIEAWNRRAPSSTSTSQGSMSEHNARFAIDAAIQFGRENRNQPPSTDHWLYEYWNIGRQLATLGATGWDNVTPMGAAPGDALDAKRWRYIEEHASARGGGNGFTITCFVPIDAEDMGCGIDAAIATSTSKGPPDAS